MSILSHVSVDSNQTPAVRKALAKTNKARMDLAEYQNRHKRLVDRVWGRVECACDNLFYGKPNYDELAVAIMTLAMMLVADKAIPKVHNAMDRLEQQQGEQDEQDGESTLLSYLVVAIENGQARLSQIIKKLKIDRPGVAGGVRYEIERAATHRTVNARTNPEEEEDKRNLTKHSNDESIGKDEIDEFVVKAMAEIGEDVLRGGNFVNGKKKPWTTKMLAEHITDTNKGRKTSPAMIHKNSPAWKAFLMLCGKTRNRRPVGDSKEDAHLNDLTGELQRLEKERADNKSRREARYIP